MTDSATSTLITLTGTGARDLIDPPANLIPGEFQIVTLVGYGLSGNDTVTGFSGPTDWPAFASANPDATLTIANHMYGGNGHDTLISSQTLPGLTALQLASYSRADTLDGGAGNDTYVINDLGVTINDASGRNTAILTENYPLVSGLTTVTVHQFNPAYANDIQNLTLRGSGDFGLEGDPSNNILRGNARHNELFGGGGDDSLFGGAGDDVLISAAGTSLLDGGAGADFIRGADGNDLLRGGDGNDSLYGDNGNDTLIGGKGADRLEGQEGDDSYYVNTQGDTVSETFGTGFDTVMSINLNLSASHYAGVEALALLGASNLSLSGGNQVVLLAGNVGNNQVRGGAANETLLGNAGADTLGGGGDGADTMTGGSGADVFTFATASQPSDDLINDFAEGEDLIDLRALGILTYAPDGSDPVGQSSVASFVDTLTLDGFATAVTVVAGDINGDGTWDFRFYLQGMTALTADDFLLYTPA